MLLLMPWPHHNHHEEAKLARDWGKKVKDDLHFQQGKAVENLGTASEGLWLLKLFVFACGVHVVVDGGSTATRGNVKALAKVGL